MNEDEKYNSDLETAYDRGFKNGLASVSVNMDDFDHWCAYNGIVDDNKQELLRIITDKIK